MAGKNDEFSLELKPLDYTIHHCSSFSVPYLPENIKDDKPHDQASRWSSDINTPPQFITIKLEKPALVTAITFGKYEKTHVCNLKRFKVYGGLDESCPIELLDSGLKNDKKKETFSLKHQVNHHNFPCAFIKIVPIKSWGPNFNFSIWYVGIRGDNNPSLIKEAVDWHDKAIEKETIKMCLKYFRQHNYLDVFESLQKKTKIQLEHPILSELHDTLVKDGDYHKTEQLLIKSLDEGLFSSWLSRQQPQLQWTPIIQPEDITTEDAILTPTPATPETEDDFSMIVAPTPCLIPVFAGQPSSRGGHQMVLDPATQSIYLFGGWDGTRDLADFWTYNIGSGKWSLLSPDTENEGGPSPRSCHKMVLDPSYRQIFVLGKYLERGLRESRSNIKSDFFVYNIETFSWTQICDDTVEVGGPNLIFDHQMCLDTEKRNIYVFGGQSLFGVPNPEESRSSHEKKFSGLYVYHIPTSTWKKLRDDTSTGEQPSIRARTGHTMLFHTRDRKLYIFGGQRKRDEYLDDFFTYDVDDGTVEFIADDTNTNDTSIPAVGYTQRSTMDWRRNEIHVMTGLNKDKSRHDMETRVSNSFWVYDILLRQWCCVYKNMNTSLAYWNKRQAVEPRPRYAHQLVYDDENATHYMFGGNPGGREGKEGKVRLGDFWKLTLERPSKSCLERRGRAMIRKTKFRELNSEKSPLEALTYLQTEVAQCVDHSNAREEKQFQLLTGELFQEVQEKSRHQLRAELFDELVALYPEDMTEPPGNLGDLVPLERTPSRRCSRIWVGEEESTV